VAIRLTLDANLRGYWGFDEALETDDARDATANAAHLTVTSATAATLGRVGGAREFNGTSSFAAVTAASLRLTGDMLLIGWFKLDSSNTSGSLLRCFVSCGGPTVGDGVLYAISVTNLGALEYRHTSAAGEVLVTSAAGVIRTGQFYSVVVRRKDNGGNQDVEIYLDNRLLTPASVLVNGSPSALPVPPPQANASAIFSVGRLQRVADSAYWDGLVDELSIHDSARTYQPYLIAVYYQTALQAATTKLTASDNVVAVSSYEMGSGIRWWCVERSGDLYVVKESPFGNFGSETRLTTPGGIGVSSTAGRPELLYDAAVDTLYVFFFAGNRIFKLTANSTDDPATINMPFTADTGGIVKSFENADGGRLGEGSGQRDPREEDFSYVNRSPVKISTQDPDVNLLGEGAGDQHTFTIGSPNEVSIGFVARPPPDGFGLFVGPNDTETGGYIVYRLDGGVATPLVPPVLIFPGANTFFVPIPSRVYGRGYFARALNSSSYPTDVVSSVIVDNFNEGTLSPGGERLDFGRNGDLADSGALGEGSAQREPREDEFVYVNRTPVKISIQDPDTNMLGEGAGGPGGSGGADGAGSWTQAGTTRVI
jgi:Concanavalin A-like lectin/glucanases superfamily